MNFLSETFCKKKKNLQDRKSPAYDAFTQAGCIHKEVVGLDDFLNMGFLTGQKTPNRRRRLTQ